MPLTDTLTSARKLEESGVPPQQARVLSELFEQTAAAQQDLKEFIAADGERTRAELRAEFRSELAASESRLRTEFQRALRQQMLWFFAMQVALGTALLTLAKFLF